MYLSVRLTDEEVQGYPLIDGNDSFNGQSERAAIDFAYDLKERHPRNTVSIVVLNDDQIPKTEEEQIQTSSPYVNYEALDRASVEELRRIIDDGGPTDLIVAAGAALAKKEDSMTVIASKDVTQAEIDATVKKIEHGLKEWEEGRMTSPDDRDHVIDAITVLGHDWHDHEALVSEIAEEIFEDSGVEIDSIENLAVFCLARLKDEGITNVKEEEPKSEYLVHINIQLPREKRIEVEQLEREISGALEVGLGSDEYAPGLQGAEVEIALAEEIG